MPSLLPPDRSPVDPDEPGESIHSVPWESLRLGDSGVDRRMWYAVAAVVAVAAMGWSAVSRVNPGEPTPPITAAVSSTLPPSPTTSSTAPIVVTEADLRAVDPIRLVRRVMAFAEAAAAEYFSGDAGGVWAGVTFDMSGSTYVERVQAVEVEDSGTGTMRVVVAVSVLDGNGDGSFERQPPRGVVIAVDALANPLQVVAFPTPATLPFGEFRSSSGAAAPVDAALAEAIRRWEPPFGTVDPESAVVQETPAGRVVELVVVDEVGNRWPMSVTVGEDGRITD